MKKEQLTKVGLMLFLYHIPTSYLGILFNCDERQFKPMIENTCKSYKRDVIHNLATFLGVSAGTIMENTNEDDGGFVYLSNVKMWIEFKYYIYFRSVNLVTDYLDSKRKKVIHKLNFDFILNTKNRKNINYLLELANNLPLINSSKLRLYNGDTYSYDQEQYTKLIYPYISEFVSNEDIGKRAEGKIYKEIVKALAEYSKDEEVINKTK